MDTARPTEDDVLREIKTMERYAASILEDSSLAEDVAQESAERAILRLPSFRGECALTTWLYRIVESQCRQVERRARQETDSHERYRVYQEIYGHDGPSDPEAVTIVDVQDAMSRMPDDLARAVYLYYLEDKTYYEVAQELGISVATTYRRVVEGIGLLQAMLKDK